MKRRRRTRTGETNSDSNSINNLQNNQLQDVNNFNGNIECQDDNGNYDFSEYYRRQNETVEESKETAFAPPVKLSQSMYFGINNTEVSKETMLDQDNNDNDIAYETNGYRLVNETENKTKKKSKKSKGKIWIYILLAVVVCAIAVFFMKDILFPVNGSLENENTNVSASTNEVAQTREPQQAYAKIDGRKVTEDTMDKIKQITKTLPIEQAFVTENQIAMKSARNDGLYDYYLFSNYDGRLLCYFEGLTQGDIMPLKDGEIYVKQAPYLIDATGEALINTRKLEHEIGQSLELNQLSNGWSVVKNEGNNMLNYINLEGKLHSRLWFSKAFPFTGDYTLAYVDTGNAVEFEDRYLLYLLSKDGENTRLSSYDSTNNVIYSIGSLAFLENGEIYHMPSMDEPIAKTDEAYYYPDCDALIVKDGNTGKYAMYVAGKQHYDYSFDRIAPVESELLFTSFKKGYVQINLLTDDTFPLPHTHFFELEKEGEIGYVSLAAVSEYPIALEGELKP